MFLKRVISAIIFAFIVILAIHKGGIWGLFVIVSIAVILSSIEFSGFVVSKKSRLLIIITIPINFLLCLSPLKPELIDTNLLLCLAIISLFTIEIVRAEIDFALLNVSASILSIIYVGWLFGRHLVLIRQMPDGREFIYLILGITWSGDIGAYLIGRQFGKHKIIPAISPKKSLEGYIAGLLFGVATSIALCHFLNLNIELYHAIILGVGLTIIGQLGDLAESLMKRSAKIKDSGKIMPGHGGILDRCDSLIFIAPSFYYYSVYILKLTGN